MDYKSKYLKYKKKYLLAKDVSGGSSNKDNYEKDDNVRSVQELERKRVAHPEQNKEVSKQKPSHEEIKTEIYESEYNSNKIFPKEISELIADYVYEKPTFTSIWHVNAGETIVLPLETDGNYNFEINWGDMTEIEHITDHNCIHRYRHTGDYTIKITGQIEGFNFLTTLQ